MPQPDGGVDQRRPPFNDFDKAIAALQTFKKTWAKLLVAHRKAAKARR